MSVDVRFEDVDGDGDREVVVENPWLRAVLRFPEKLGEEFYARRFTWGGRLQSLVYKPSGREFFLPEMINPENNRPFGLPDELFASFPLEEENGRERHLKMGVGVFSQEGERTLLEPLPWTWREEEIGEEKVVVFRQEAENLGGYSFAYEKRYRFRAEAAWFALDVVWENRGEATIASDWDIHSFHDAGKPPHTSWLVAPKRAWVSYGKTRMRTVLKEASPTFISPDVNAMVADLIAWDLEGTPWWYALGPGDGEEFYLLNARFEPYRGLFWAGWGAFTPQGINHVEVPPGNRAVWGFDVTLGTGGRNFVCAGENGGLTIDRKGRSAVVGVHLAEKREGSLKVHLLDQDGAVRQVKTQAGQGQPGAPLRLEVDLPDKGDYAVVEAVYEEDGRALLHSREMVALTAQRPTAHLPFRAEGAKVFVGCQPDLEKGEVDGIYLYTHGLHAGFGVDWPGGAAPEDLEDYSLICAVGDAWPQERTEELRRWVEAGGGLLLCAPFGDLIRDLGDLAPLQPEEGGKMQQADPALGLKAGTDHCTAERLMLDPDALVRVTHWTPCTAHPDALVTLRFTDANQHPAVALKTAQKGRVAALASRPAWGRDPRSAIWDGWGQYHRACFAGLMGWLAGVWRE